MSNLFEQSPIFLQQIDASSDDSINKIDLGQIEGMQMTDTTMPAGPMNDPMMQYNPDSTMGIEEQINLAEQQTGVRQNELRQSLGLLRKVPLPYGSGMPPDQDMTADMMQGMSPEMIEAMAGTSPEMMENIPPDQDMTADMMQNMSMMETIPPEAMAGMSPEMMENVPPEATGMSPEMMETMPPNASSGPDSLSERVSESAALNAELQKAFTVCDKLADTTLEGISTDACKTSMQCALKKSIAVNASTPYDILPILQKECPENTTTYFKCVGSILFLNRKENDRNAQYVYEQPYLQTCIRDNGEKIVVPGSPQPVDPLGTTGVGVAKSSSIYDRLPADTKIVSCFYSNPLYQTLYERVSNCTLAAGTSNNLIECRKTDVCKQQPDGFWKCRIPLTTPKNEREMLNTSTRVYKMAVAKYGEDNFCQEYMSDEYDVRFADELYVGVECNNNRCDYRPYPDEIECTYSNDIYEQINDEVAKCNEIPGSNNKYGGCTKNEICTQDAATGNWTCNIPLIDFDTENKDDVDVYRENDYNVLNVTRRQYLESYKRYGKENHCSELTDAVNRGELADGKPIICKNNVCETLSVDITSPSTMTCTWSNEFYQAVKDYHNKRNDERCKEMQEMVGPDASDTLEVCNEKVIKHCEVKDGIDIDQMKNDIRSQREDEELNETEIFARLNLDDVLKSCNPSDVCTQNADTTWTCTTNLFINAESDDTIFNTDVRNFKYAVKRNGADNYCRRFAQQARVGQKSVGDRTECTNNNCLTKSLNEYIPEDTMTMTCKFTDDVYQEMDTWKTEYVNEYCFTNDWGETKNCYKSEVCTKNGNIWTCNIPLYDYPSGPSGYHYDETLFNTNKEIYNKAVEEFGTENACQYYIKHHKNASQLRCENNLCGYQNQKFCYLSPSLYDSMNFNIFSSFLSTCQYDENKGQRKCSINPQSSCENTIRDLISEKLRYNNFDGIKRIDQNNPDSDLSHRAAIFMNTGASCTVNAGEEMCDLNDPFLCKLDAAAYNAINESNIFDGNAFKFVFTKMCKREDDGYYYCHFDNDLRRRESGKMSCDQLISNIPPKANINGTFSCDSFDICRFNPTMVDTIPEMGIGSCDPEKTRRAMQIGMYGAKRDPMGVPVEAITGIGMADVPPEAISGIGMAVVPPGAMAGMRP